MKNNTDKIYNILKRIPTRTYVSLVLVVIAIINYALLAADRPIINLGEAEITYAVNTIISVIVILYGVYKNNSTSEYAILCDQILYYLRDGKLTKEEVKDFINKYNNEDVEKVVETSNTDTVEVKDEELKQ